MTATNMGGRPAAMTAEQWRDAIFAWHGSQTAGAIAAAIGISQSTLRRAWCAAQRAGELPEGDRAGLGETEIRSIEPGRDPLLAALIREHGADPRRAHDTVRVDRFDRLIIKTRQPA